MRPRTLPPLDLTNLIRTEYVSCSYGRRGRKGEEKTSRTHTAPIYVFKCKKDGCDNETRVQSGKHRNWTGVCQSCAARKLPYQSSYNTLRSGAAVRGHELNLTYEEFLTFTQVNNCHYCNCDITWVKHRKSKSQFQGYNLDRKDLEKGYSLDNCVVCCATCNYTRGDRFTYDEFMLLAPVLRRINETRSSCHP